MKKSVDTLPPTRNHILGGLSREDRRLLNPDLHAVDLPAGCRLERHNRRIEHVYFPESGIASVVAHGAGGRWSEVGLIGREGIIGIGLVMGVHSSSHDTSVRLAGRGSRITSEKFLRAIEQRPSLQRSCLLFAHSLFSQTADTALAGASNNVEKRLVRWLLMAHERVDGDDLAVTHEFLSGILATRRSGVTATLNNLERRGLIGARRGVVTIIDRRGLQELRMLA